MSHLGEKIDKPGPESFMKHINTNLPEVKPFKYFIFVSKNMENINKLPLNLHVIHIRIFLMIHLPNFEKNIFV